MASANGNTISGGSTSAGTAYSWRAIIEATVSSESSTQIKYSVKLKYYTLYAIDVYSNGKFTSGASGSWSGSMKSTSNSGKTVTVITKSVTVSKGSSSKSQTFAGYIQNTGGFGNGKSTATLKVTVPAIDYSAPNAPSGVSATRNSDSQAAVKWTNGSTSTTKPRSSSKVERQTDAGSWSQIASVGSSTANYTDNSISANHRYAYRVRAKGSGGYSGYATSGYIYTTPAAPSSVSLTKLTDTQVQIEIAGAAQWATSYDVERSVNSGEWESASSVTAWPYVDNPGGGTVKYRVRAVRGSLASAWTESTEIATITPPYAPSVVLDPSASVIPTGSSLYVRWTPNHPDGSAQESAQLEISINGASQGKTVVSGSATSYDLSSYTSVVRTISVRVRTKGLDPSYGEWSQASVVQVAVPPSAYFEVPGDDEAIISNLPLTVKWVAYDSTGIAYQQIRLFEDGRQVFTAEPAIFDTQFTFDDSTYRLSNNLEYRVELDVRGGSSLASTAVCYFKTEFAQPEPPVVYTGVDYSDMSVSIEVHTGPSQSEESDVVEVDGREGTAMSGFTVYGQTRQNLWSNPATQTMGGITLTNNADGTITISGAFDGTNVNISSDYIYALKPSTQYLLSINKAVLNSGGGYFVLQQFDAEGALISGGSKFIGYGTVLSIAFTTDAAMDKCRCVFYANANGIITNGTYRVMLNEGTEAEPWCPPGLSVIDDESITMVTAGKNLGGTPPENVTWGTSSSDCVEKLNLLPNGVYTCSMDFELWEKRDNFSGADTCGIIFGVGSEDYTVYSRNTQWGDDADIGDEKHVSATFTVDDHNRGKFSVCWFYGCGVSGNVESTGSAYVKNFQIERGDEETAYEDPSITETDINLNGNTICSLPDGTKDEIKVDSSGSVTLYKRTWYAEMPKVMSQWTDYNSYAKEGNLTKPAKVTDIDASNMMCNSAIVKADPVSSSDIAPCVGIDMAMEDKLLFNYGGVGTVLQAVLMTAGINVVYPIQEIEIDLGSVVLPVYPTVDAQVFLTTGTPLSVDYPEANEITVERQLPDGSRWTVASGLSDGDECIDPLPPLNTDYTYLVTAYTETGLAATLNSDAVIETTKAAYNFGKAAEECFTTEFDFDFSDGYDHDGELIHFAGNSLPIFYGTDSLENGGSQSFHVIGREKSDAIRDIFKRYSVGWLRRTDGRRERAYMSASFDGKTISPVVEVKVNTDEIVFGEAW